MERFGKIIVGGPIMPAGTFCLAAVAELSEQSTKSVEKDKLIELSNMLQKKYQNREVSADCESDWDDIFNSLAVLELLELDIHSVQLTERALSMIDDYFPQGINI